MKRWAIGAPRIQSSAAIIDEKVSRLPNGMTVGSLDMGGVVSQLVFAFRGGSRFEQPDEKGLVHHLRNAVGTDSNNYLGPQMLWQCGSAGANLKSSITRDIFAVQMSVVRDNASVGLSLLGELAQPAFKPWNVEETAETIDTDLSYLEPYELLMEDVHYAAFRSGPLGNRLFSERANVGKISYKMLMDYAASRLVSGQAVVVGINIEHAELLGYVSEQLSVVEAPGQELSPSPYFGGELRHPTSSKLSHLAVVGSGSSLQDSKRLAIQAVLAAAVGQGPPTRFSSRAGNGVLSDAVYKASSGSPFGFSAINEAYSDEGLVGFYLVADGDKIGPLITAAISALKSFKVDDVLLRNSKRIAIMNVLLRAQSSEDLAMDRAVQLLATGRTVSVSQLIDLINSVNATEVQKAAEQFASKMTMASRGNIYQVPYLDQI